MYIVLFQQGINLNCECQATQDPEPNSRQCGVYHPSQHISDALQCLEGYISPSAKRECSTKFIPSTPMIHRYHRCADHTVVEIMVSCLIPC